MQTSKIGNSNLDCHEDYYQDDEKDFFILVDTEENESDKEVS
jgi:hypothetical protein